MSDDNALRQAQDSEYTALSKALALIPSPDDSPQEQSSPLDNIPSYPPAAREYLLLRPQYDTVHRTLSALGISNKSRETWRNKLVGFRVAESYILSRAGDAKTRLARSLFREAAPIVAYRQSALATAEDATQRDRVQAQQRAREQVLRGAGVMEASESDEGMAGITLRLWSKRRRG